VSVLDDIIAGVLDDLKEREDRVRRARPVTPTVLDYQKMADADSMLNTPPTFAIYLLGLIGHWIEDGGGLEAMAERNRAKAELLYGYIDSSDFYANPVQERSRSWMNVPFTLADPARDADFLAGAPAAPGHIARLWLNDAVTQVLRTGLGLLGVSAPERM